MNHVLVAVGWGIIGAAAGWLARWGSVKLALLEGLEPGHRPWQVWGPPILTAIIFAGLGYVFGAELLLLLRSVFALVLVQVIFFDFEHRLILDRVLFPSIALALVVSLLENPWWAGLATGIGAGLLFTFLAVAGAFLFKTEALGVRAVLRSVPRRRGFDRRHRLAAFIEGHDRVRSIPRGGSADRPVPNAIA